MRANVNGVKWTATIAILTVLVAATPLRGSASMLGDETIAIENARIVTVSGPVIEKGTVVIEKGKIAAVGANVQAPAKARRIDATGLSVYPGMIDSSTVLGLVEVGSVSGSTDTNELGDFKPHLMAYTAFNPNSELILAARVAGVTSAISIPRGGVFSGQPMLADLDGRTVDDMAVQKSVGLFFSFPTGVGGRTFDFSTFTFRRTSDSEARQARDKRVDEIRSYLRDAQAYLTAIDARAKDPNLPPIVHDLKLDALRPVLAGTLPVIVSASDPRDIRAAVAFCEEMKLRCILDADIDLPPAELTKLATFLAEKKIPVILGPQYRLPSREDDRYDLPQQAPNALVQAGVKIAFSTEDSAQVRDLPYNASMAVAYGGLSPADAYKAISLWPAEIWGVSDRLGSIEVGKYANLIVTTGDPLEVRTDVKHVFIEGKQIPMTSRPQQFYETYRSR